MTRLLRDSLEGVLDEHEMGQLVSAFDQIGSIIVIRIPQSLHDKRHVIGETLLEKVKIADRVFCQVSDVAGDYRTRNLELVAGEGDTTTIHRENGCRFLVDVEQVLFTPHLSTERDRVAALVGPGRTVINMFGGVGMFSMPIARRVPSTVYNIDINPRAIELCRHNITLNRLAGRIIPMAGDAGTILWDMEDMADHTLMPLPEDTDRFLDAAVHATKRGGTIHYYSHIHADHKHDAAALSERHLGSILQADFRVAGSRLVSAVGPRYYQTVVDMVLL